MRVFVAIFSLFFFQLTSLQAQVVQSSTNVVQEYPVVLPKTTNLSLRPCHEGIESGPAICIVNMARFLKTKTLNSSLPSGAIIIGASTSIPAVSQQQMVAYIMAKSGVSEAAFYTTLKIDELPGISQVMLLTSDQAALLQRAGALVYGLPLTYKSQGQLPSILEVVSTRVNFVSESISASGGVPPAYITNVGSNGASVNAFVVLPYKLSSVAALSGVQSVTPLSPDNAATLDMRYGYDTFQSYIVALGNSGLVSTFSDLMSSQGAQNIQTACGGAGGGERSSLAGSKGDDGKGGDGKDGGDSHSSTSIGCNFVSFDASFATAMQAYTSNMVVSFNWQSPPVIRLVQSPNQSDLAFTYSLLSNVNINYQREVGGFTRLPANIDGAGVTVGVVDPQMDFLHQGFSSESGGAVRPESMYIPAYPLDSTMVSHGTGVVGIIANSNSPAPNLGNAPRASVYFTSFLNFPDLALFRLPHAQQMADLGVALENYSVGGVPSLGYNTISAAVDYAILRSDLFMTQAMGNYSSSCRSATGSLARPEAWSKNVMTVGGVSHLGTIARTDDSFFGMNSNPVPAGGPSCGPAADGRQKPEMVHFSQQNSAGLYGLNSARSTWSEQGFNRDYNSIAGTSASTAAISGYATLAADMWRRGVLTSGVTPTVPLRSATLKALLVNYAESYNLPQDPNGAFNTNSIIRRIYQGFGLPDVGAMFTQAVTPGKTYILNGNSPIMNGQIQWFVIRTYSSSNRDLKVTLSYNDPASIVNPNPLTRTLVNDLDLRFAYIQDSQAGYYSLNPGEPNNCSGSGGCHGLRIPANSNRTALWGNDGIIEQPGSSRAPMGGGYVNVDLTNDDKNNTENISVRVIGSSSYRTHHFLVGVMARQILSDANPATPEADQGFSLVVNGGECVAHYVQNSGLNYAPCPTVN